MTMAEERLLGKFSLWTVNTDDPEFAVYILIEGARLLYVGSSIKLCARIAQHRANKVSFNEVYFLRCNSNREMKDAERLLIRGLAPPLNGELHKPQPNRITIRLSPDLIKGLNAASSAVNRTPSNMMKFLLRNHLETLGLL